MQHGIRQVKKEDIEYRPNKIDKALGKAVAAFVLVNEIITSVAAYPQFREVAGNTIAPVLTISMGLSILALTPTINRFATNTFAHNGDRIFIKPEYRKPINKALSPVGPIIYI